MNSIIPMEEVSPLAAADPSTPSFQKPRISPYERSHQINKRHQKEIERLSLSSSSSYGTPELEVKKMTGADFLAHIRGTKFKSRRERKLRKFVKANPTYQEEEIDRLITKYPEHFAKKFANEDLEIGENEFREIDTKANFKKFEILSRKLEAWQDSPEDQPPLKKRKLSPEDERKTV